MALKKAKAVVKKVMEAVKAKAPAVPPHVTARNKFLRQHRPGWHVAMQRQNEPQRRD